MCGLMEENMKDHGKIIKCMVEEYSFGLTEEDMKDNIRMIKNRDMDNLYGQMVEVILALMRMALSMGLGRLFILMEGNILGAGIRDSNMEKVFIQI